MILGLKRGVVSKIAKFARSSLSEEHDLLKVERYLESCTSFCPAQKSAKFDGRVLQLQSSVLNSTEFGSLDIGNLHSDSGISKNSDGIYFQVPAKSLVEAVLTDINCNPTSYGKRQASKVTQYFNGKKLVNIPRKENVVIDFSSPNIAKPFHAGHLRSTVIGMFVVNISKLFDQNITSVNYLGDWGTQFGYMAVGFEKYGSEDALNKNPIQHLFDVYVRINKDGDADPSVHSRAMSFFKSLEEGDEKAVDFWQKCKGASIDELNKMYQRLGISFDETTGESQYSAKAKNLILMLRERNLMEVNEKTGVQYVDVTEEGDKAPVFANLLKSDGSTLYLTRDVAAALERYTEYNADKLIYVVEGGQYLHFQHLERILQKLRPGFRGNNGLLHLRFGRVEKMSTRKGEVVLLRDVLDEAGSLMRERMLGKHTTKVEGEDLDLVAEKLAVCGIVVQDLKRFRVHNYAFNWNEVLSFEGNTGVFLQYTHARLCSLLRNTDDIPPDYSIDFKVLSEDSAVQLVLHLARFDEVLIKSYMEYEAFYLMQYLFTLGGLINIAHRELQVKNQPRDVANARSMLFKSARQVLRNGLNVIGIEPLERI